MLQMRHAHSAYFLSAVCPGFGTEQHSHLNSRCCCFMLFCLVGLFVLRVSRNPSQHSKHQIQCRACGSLSFFEGFHKSMHQRMFSTQRRSRSKHCSHLKLNISVISCMKTWFDKNMRSNTFRTFQGGEFRVRCWQAACLWCVSLTLGYQTKGSGWEV